jgi:ankyrin repeat protein
MESETAFELATRAIAGGDVPHLERVLTESPHVLAERDADGHTLLGLACRAATGNIALPPVPGAPEHHAAVDLILAAGADPSAAANDGFAPLHAAAMTNHVDLARRLLAAGAPREGRLLGARGGSPLSLALFCGQITIAELLATAPVPDSLRTAAALGHSLDRFFDGEELTPEAANGADFYRPLFAYPEWQRTFERQELLDEALTWAARNDRCATMAELVRRGANVNANPYRGTPLLWATYADRVAAATWLLDHGADPNLRHDFGGAEHGKSAVALHLAAQYGCLGCLRLLLSYGADPNIRDAAYHATPLGWAEHEGAEEAAAIVRASMP